MYCLLCLSSPSNPVWWWWRHARELRWQAWDRHKHTARRNYPTGRPGMSNVKLCRDYIRVSRNKISPRPGLGINTGHAIQVATLRDAPPKSPLSHHPTNPPHRAKLMPSALAQLPRGSLAPGPGSGTAAATAETPNWRRAPARGAAAATSAALRWRARRRWRSIPATAAS